MSGHDDQRDVWHDAWDDAVAHAERAGDGYEVPVGLVRTRARRRRRTRAATQGGAALAAVAAVVLAVPPLLEDRADEAVLLAGDWPEQFDRCGQQVEAAALGVSGPLDVGLTVPDVGGDRILLTTTRATFDPAQVADVLPVVPDEVLLVRDGVVVGVEDSAHDLAVLLEDAVTDGPGEEAWSFGSPMVSCDQYPDGTGDARLPAGRYEAVTTQKVAWRTVDGARHTETVTLTAPVTVTEEIRATSVEPGACGGGVDVLAALADPGTNPFPVAVEADVPPTVATGSDLRVPVRATHSGRGTVEAAAAGVGVVLTRDGHVVATTVPAVTSAGRTTFPAHEPRTFDAVAPLVRCDVDDPALPLDPGEHDLWVVLDLRRASADGTQDVQVVGGPWRVVVE